MYDSNSKQSGNGKNYGDRAKRSGGEQEEGAQRSSTGTAGQRLSTVQVGMGGRMSIYKTISER